MRLPFVALQQHAHQFLADALPQQVQQDADFHSLSRLTVRLHEGDFFTLGISFFLFGFCW
jgi:hypothetical protein